MFRYLLVMPDGEPNDPAVFITMVPNWTIGEVITLGAGDQLRLVEMDDEIAGELVARGFTGVLTVEPA